MSDNWTKKAASWNGQTWAERALMSLRFLVIKGFITEGERDKALRRMRKEMSRSLPPGRLDP